MQLLTFEKNTVLTFVTKIMEDSVKSSVQIQFKNIEVEINKTGTSQVGAISKAQKAQNIFFWKKT